MGETLIATRAIVFRFGFYRVYFVCVCVCVLILLRFFFPGLCGRLVFCFSFVPVLGRMPMATGRERRNSSDGRGTLTSGCHEPPCRPITIKMGHLNISRRWRRIKIQCNGQRRQHKRTVAAAVTSMTATAVACCSPSMTSPAGSAKPGTTR